MKYAVYLDSGVSLEVDYDADKEEILNDSVTMLPRNYWSIYRTILMM